MKTRDNKPRQRFPVESLRLKRSGTVAIFRQLEEQLRDAIWQGRLKPGERLPSTRQLANELGIARNTVVSAYEQLSVEGFIHTHKGSGTSVAKHFPPPLKNIPVTHDKTLTNTPEDTSVFAHHLQHLTPIERLIPNKDSPPLRPFRPHTPACDQFPRHIWAQLTTRRLRKMPRSWLERHSPAGNKHLREAIAGYLGASRNMLTSPEEVFVTAGVQQAIILLAKLLINPGDIVCVEDPGYTPATVVFQLAGAKVVPIPVDQHGLNVDFLANKVKRAKLIYVTPANQYPLGVSLHQTRRKALVQWACKRGALIIEDDYNGEYQYRGRPLTTLHTTADSGQVIYLGSFSKLLFPALRIGYMIVPPAFIKPLSTLRWLVDRHSPPLEQAVLADFINEGHFARHLRRMRTLYATRQASLVSAAKKYLNDVISIEAKDSGLHLIGWLADGVDEKALLFSAQKAAIDLLPLSEFDLQGNQKPGLILGYAPFKPEAIETSAKRLRDTFAACSR